MAERHYAGSAEETVKKLNSDSARGLTHKSARARFGRARLSDERDFYYVPKYTWSASAAPCMSDFSFWILLLTSGTLALFEHTALAVVLLFILVANLLFSVIALQISARLSQRLTSGFSPKVKVIREGRLFLTDCRYVVRGDVVILSKGDAVPFDARLISAEDLTVSVYIGKDRDHKDSFVERKKDPSARLDGRKILPPEEQSNMVTAGSVIVSGSGRAIVTETGTYTYIGALTGGIPIDMGKEYSTFTSTILIWSRRIGMLLLLLLIPLTVATYFLGSGHDLSVSFLTVLSILSLVIPGWIIALSNLSASYKVYRFVKQKHIPYGLLFRNASICERLASLDILALFDKAMLTDGRPHVIGIFANGRSLRDEAIRDTDCRPLVEKALLFQKKSSEAPTRNSGYSISASDELIGKELLTYASYIGVDREMLDIRYRANDYRAKNEENPIALLEYSETVNGEERTAVLCNAIGEALLLRATHIRIAGEDVLFSEEKRKTALSFAASCERRGGEISCYAEKNEKGQLVFLGLIAYGELVVKGTRDTVSSLSALGVRTILFLESESPSEGYYARMAGIVLSDSEIALASEFRKEGREITDGFGTYSLYLGFSSAEIASLLHTLEKNRMRVGGVMLRQAEEAILESLMISVACGEGRIDTRSTIGNEVIELPITGVEQGTEAPEAMKQRSDVLVRRASPRGGGIASIAQAFTLGRQLLGVRKRFLSFLIIHFGFSFGWLLPILLSSARDLYPALMLTFSGLIASAFTGAAILFTNVGDCDPALMGGSYDELRGSGQIIRTVIGSVAISAVLGFLLSFIPILAAIFTDISPLLVRGYRALCLLSVHAFGILSFRTRFKKKGRRNEKT